MQIASPCTLKTPLPAQTLRVHSMSCTGGLGQLDELHLALLSPQADIEAEKLLGQAVDLQLRLPGGSLRHFCGLVTRFGIGARQAGHYGYSATVRPWLWFLTRTTDCRIFQEQTVPEIIDTVFKDHASYASFQSKLVRSYRKRSYCVQYRESDYNFVSRLMEDEGIYWYFEHAQGSHTLMLMDSPDAHEPMAGKTLLPFHEGSGSAAPQVECVSQWQCSRGVRTGALALTSYDFERPAVSLLAKQLLARGHALDALEAFDFQGDYNAATHGQRQADDRLDAQQARFERLAGRSNASALAAGRVFELARHPRADQNGKYLCTAFEFNMQGEAVESEQGGGGVDVQFQAIRADAVFRPPRRTSKPFVQGPQTAVVVGPAGEEIHTDRYGRVKVQFHWDRYGKKDEKSSCWVRVSSPWAGKNFGFMQVPRIGQEVVVDFLEGDPDQPLITGRVYNGNQMPPWELPANATQSGLLTRSSKGGSYGQANALRFEDKVGAEELWLHAEKDQRFEVENDESHWVGRDRQKKVDHDETTLIGHDLQETVVNNQTVTIGGMHVETVKLAKAETVYLAKALSIGLGYQTTVGAAMNTSVVLSQSAQVGVSKSTHVGKSYNITAGDSFSVTVGKARLTMTSDGKVTIVGSQFLFDASGPVQINGKDIDLN